MCGTRSLVPVDGAAGVLRCPVCDHRTDKTGDGVLEDGFDIVHRQWGRRGDPHAWRAMQDLLATTSTPATLDGVRQAFLDGFREVADVEWWRTKGIPLLVDRAIERRPTMAPPAPGHGASGSVRHHAATVAIWALVLAIPAGMAGGGNWLLYQRAVGTRVDATVLPCDSSGNFRRYGSTFRTDCVAEWTIDGRVIIGGFSGGNGESDVGKTVAATVRGDTAYSRSFDPADPADRARTAIPPDSLRRDQRKARGKAPETTSAAGTSG